MTRKFDRKLVLENGREFYGYGFGAQAEALGEAVFNTEMAGYQEVLSDPSYTGQLVVMTFPLIGGYGVNDEDSEARTPTMGGLVVREYCDEPSNFRYTKTLAELMEEHGVPGISGLDTRALTRVLRDEGSQRVLLTAAEAPLEQALARVKAYAPPTDLVERVSCKKRWYARTSKHQYNVVAVDCGIKLGIVRCLNARGCNVTVVPYNTPAAEILALHPDGVLLSNGPGNPESVTPVIELVRELRGKLPIFGICMGFQMVALAYGARSCKLKNRHCGGNHTVRNLDTGKLETSCQNHIYTIDPASLEGTGLRLTHVHVLDGTPEGIACDADKVFAVQYHPEGAPGPLDGGYLFDRFVAVMQSEKEGNHHA